MPNELDQDAVRLAKAIRQRESGGNFTARGKSGEFGAYQFTKPTWQNYAQKHLGNANAPLTPQNQNQVAYKQIKEWKDQGYRPDQISSMWNSGKPDYQGNVGVNQHGVKYDVPSYVQGVRQEYEKLKQADMQRPQTPQGGGVIPTAYAAETEQAPQETGMQKWGRRLDSWFGGGKIGEAIGTQIAKGNLGTTLQKWTTGSDLTPEQEAQVSAGPTGRQLVADAARVGVNFFPVGRVGGAITGGLAREGVKRMARPLGNIASQALAGYAYDVTEGVRQGEENPYRPGMGTYMGLGFGALGSAGSAGLRKLGQQTGQQKLADLTKGMSSLTNSLNKNTKKGGVTPLQTLEREGLMPTVQDGKIVADEIRAQLQQRLASLAEQTRGVIASSGKEVPWSTFKNEIQTTIKNDKLLQNLGKTETVMKNANVILESYRRSYGNKIPVSAIDDIRKAANTQWKDDVRDMYRAIGDASRKIVYDVVPDNTVRDALRQEGELLAASDFAKSLHGKAVKGGRLGTGMSQIIGGMVGTGVGALGGPLTAGVAGLAGAGVAGKVSQTFQKNYFKTPLANVARKITNTLDNTPLTPGDRLLQTEAGQSLERSVKDSLRKPGLGLSMRDVSGGKKDIAEEAKKYKSAEEFVKNRLPSKPVTTNPNNYGETKTYKVLEQSWNSKKDSVTMPKGSTVFRGGDEGVYHSADLGTAESYAIDNAPISAVDISGKKLANFQIFTDGKYASDPSVDLVSVLKKALDEGYDGLYSRDNYGEVILPTKSQLTDIWNKANKPAPKPLVVAKRDAKSAIAKDSAVTEAFEKSTGQKQVGKFEVGSFGENAFARKVDQKDRFPLSELEKTQDRIVGAYRASPDKKNYRSDNIAWVAKMPDGETRVIYTRKNSSGIEEVLNGHVVSDPRYVATLKTFGVPAETRTRIFPLERGASNPLNYRDNFRIRQDGGDVNALVPIGGGAGVEQDEEGNMEVDPLKLALGLGGGLLGARALAKLGKRGEVPARKNRGEFRGVSKGGNIREQELKVTHANVQKRLDNARKEGNKITARRLEKEAQRLMEEMQKERMRVLK